MGIPACTPNLRAAYDADVTTPRESARPPTITSSARPAPSGSASMAHLTKYESQSASRMRGVDTVRKCESAKVRKCESKNGAVDECAGTALKKDNPKSCRRVRILRALVGGGGCEAGRANEFA